MGTWKDSGVSQLNLIKNDDLIAKYSNRPEHYVTKSGTQFQTVMKRAEERIQLPKVIRKWVNIYC